MISILLTLIPLPLSLLAHPLAPPGLTFHNCGAPDARAERMNSVPRHPTPVGQVRQADRRRALVHVGSFDSLEEADAAARAKRNELFTANYVDRLVSAYDEISCCAR